MREIKFRAYIKDIHTIEDVEAIYFNQSKSGKDVIINGEWYSFEEVELLQYTGLKDRNGKKIYEGDIVTFNLLNSDSEGRGVVLFVYDSFIIQTNHILADNGKYLGLPLTCDLGRLIKNDRDVVVIGNTYKHPHLLEKTE